MDDLLLKTEEKMTKVIDNMEKRFINIRAGRANPGMLDPIVIEYYGVATPLRQLANISVPEARQLMIKPFDRSCLSAIEKGIYEADLGVTPNNNGECIFIVIPPLTEERRKELVKQVKQIAEEGRIALRNVRQDANSDATKLEISEDDEKRIMDQVQKLIDKFNKIVEEKYKIKENDLMSL